VGLVGSEIESRGIPTVTLAMERGVDAPRVAFAPFPYNYPMGEPQDHERHREVALAALALLEELEKPKEVALPFHWREE
jgi:D-proline reductase (dithiol) PrdB